VSAPPTGKLARGAVGGMALAQAGVARVSRQARKLTRSAAGQDQAQREFESEVGRILFRALNQLKGTALKLSQLLSAHAAFLPEGIRKELAKGCYQVTPLNRALVHKVFRSEFGLAPEQLFAHFDSDAFAAASLGQVHHARLDDGSPVAVKVQYPGIAASVTSDLRMLRAMVLAMGGDLLPPRQLVEQVLDEAGAKLAEELDYLHEAQQLEWFRGQVRMEGIVIPAPVASRCTRRVLTMEHLDGLHLDQWLATKPTQAQRDHFGQLLFDWFFYSLFELGRLHADPHPGNFLFMPDGRLGVIDFGCTRTVSGGFRASLACAWNAALDLPAPGAQAALRQSYVELELISAMLTQEEFDRRLMPVLSPFISWQVEPFRGGRCDFTRRSPVPAATPDKARQFAGFTIGMHADLPYFDRAYVGIMHLLHTLGANVATANRWINEKGTAR
jgi:predicted unusual protein kinase regulating ubiquinone biosynthesis (AarF/ABC1/UbiB family)